ncbi:MAG: hypothetical protein EON61_22500 [Alphaproteobacteria bacterium]|nr:MAG: hypothetical protein EON61_22500 [Alphaproteobacteria bacterium]
MEETHRIHTAAHLAGELKDFYTLGSECLWVTFHRGRLYWAIATPEISFDKNAEPPRRRRTSGGWISTDVSGKPLDHFTLSSAITQTRMARGTICQPQAWRKYISLIRSEPNPLIDRARIEQAQLTSTLAQLIETLDQHDFEVLAQRVAESLGWRIETGIGGVQPDIDFAATLPALGLKGYFQVKTRSTQTQLEAFVASMPAASDARIVFVTHKRGHLQAGANPNLEIWAGEDLAQKAINAGLMAWMLERAQ